MYIHVSFTQLHVHYLDDCSNMYMYMYIIDSIFKHEFTFVHSLWKCNNLKQEKNSEYVIVIASAFNQTVEC